MMRAMLRTWIAMVLLIGIGFGLTSQAFGAEATDTTPAGTDTGEDGAVVDPAESEAIDEEARRVDPTNFDWTPPSVDNIRHPLADVVEVRRTYTAWAIARVQEEQGQEIIDPEPSQNDELPRGTEDTGEERSIQVERILTFLANQTRDYISSVEAQMLQENWLSAREQARQAIDQMSGWMNDPEIVIANPDQTLRQLLEDHPQRLASINTGIQRLERARQQIEAVIIREEAEAHFESLGLELQGVLHSENEDAWPSLAIVLDPAEGLPRIVQEGDRIAETTITSIEVDSVRFSYIWRFRPFEAQIFIDE